MLSNSTQDPDNFWTNLKKIFPSKQKDPTKRFTINSVTTADTNTVANAFCSFFSNIVSKLKIKNLCSYKLCVEKTNSRTPYIPVKCSLSETSTREQYTVNYVNSNAKKSAGIDDIPPSVLTDAADVLAKPLARIINISLETGVFPSD